MPRKALISIRIPTLLFDGYDQKAVAIEMFYAGVVDVSAC